MLSVLQCSTAVQTVKDLTAKKRSDRLQANGFVKKGKYTGLNVKMLVVSRQ